MNINNPTTFGTPSLTLSTSNSSGTGGALRADDTILVYDTTVPTTIASAASANTGDTATAARRNHTHGMYTVTAQSSQAALEAETDEDTYAPPDLIKHSPGVAKGYTRLNSAGSSAIGSYNLASAGRDGTGDYNATWAVDFANTQYTALVGVDTNDAGFQSQINSLAAGITGWLTFNESDSAVDAPNQIAVLGDQ